MTTGSIPSKQNRAKFGAISNPIDEQEGGNGYQPSRGRSPIDWEMKPYLSAYS